MYNLKPNDFIQIFDLKNKIIFKGIFSDLNIPLNNFKILGMSVYKENDISYISFIVKN